MQQSYPTETAPCRCANPRYTPRTAHKRCFYEIKQRLVSFCSCLVWYCGCLSSSSPRLLKRANQNAASPNVIDYTGARKVQTAIPLLLREPLRVAVIGSKEFWNCLRTIMIIIIMMITMARLYNSHWLWFIHNIQTQELQSISII